MLLRASCTGGRWYYGSPRIHDDFIEWGERVSRKRVIRLPQEDGLIARVVKRYTVTTDCESPWIDSAEALAVHSQKSADTLSNLERIVMNLNARHVEAPDLRVWQRTMMPMWVFLRDRPMAEKYSRAQELLYAYGLALICCLQGAHMR